VSAHCYSWLEQQQFSFLALSQFALTYIDILLILISAETQRWDEGANSFQES
jgi:hypothetical protein